MPAIRAHARTARGLHEVGGRLVVADQGDGVGRIERYIAGTNRELEAGWFSDDDADYPPAPPGSQLVLLHTQPGADAGGTTSPSRGDLEVCFEHGDQLLAIYAPRWDRLAIWRVIDAYTYARIPLIIESLGRAGRTRPGGRR